MKSCKKCNLEKDYSEFYRHNETKDGFFNVCKACLKSKDKERARRIARNRKKSDTPLKKKCRKCEKTLPSSNFCKHNRNFDGLRNVCKKCDTKQRRENRVKQIERDPFVKVVYRIRSLIYSSIKKSGYTKKSKSYEILGIDYEGFKKHIESQFAEGMSWDNHGEWHLDHIIPISAAKNESEVVSFNHYTNFQPLWAEDNLKKSNKLNYKV